MLGITLEVRFRRSALPICIFPLRGRWTRSCSFARPRSRLACSRFGLVEGGRARLGQGSSNAKTDDFVPEFVPVVHVVVHVAAEGGTAVGLVGVTASAPIHAARP